MLNYYEILGVKPNTSLKEIKYSFRKKAKKIHPDVNSKEKTSAEKEMRLLIHAYKVLSSPQKRKEYDRTLLSQKKPSSFNYRQFLKSRPHDMKCLSKLIFYDILNDNNLEAVLLYEELNSKKGFQLENYLKYGDYMDCAFLLAEEFEKQKEYKKAFLLFKKIYKLEKKRPYFHHFSEEIIHKIRNLISTKLLKNTNRDWYILNIQELLVLNLPDKDKAFLCKKIAEYHLRYDEKDTALYYIKKALKYDTKISGTKKIIDRIGFAEITV